MNDKEQVIQEKRTSEAVRKNLMGPEGKLGCIVKMLGEPIINQSEGGALYSGSSFNYYDFLNNEDSYEIPTMAIDGTPEPIGDEWQKNENRIDYSIHEEGYYFYALSRGVDLEIKYLEADNKLDVHYKGILVYEELDTKLTAFVPSPEWEGYVDKFYQVAKNRVKLKKKEIEEENKQTIKTNKKNWLQKVKTRWGF